MKKSFLGLLVGVLANPTVAQAYCYTVTTDTVEGTAITATGEVSSGYVPYGNQRYLKNNSFSPSCKNISNSSAMKLELYVPAYTQAEWTSFLKSLPAGVTAADCTYKTTTTCTSESSSGGGGGGGGSDHYSQESHYNSDGTLTTTTTTNGGTVTRTTNNAINKSGGVQDYSSHLGGPSSGSGSSSSSRVICTYFMKKGMIPKDLWRADLTFTEMYISKTTVRGYHFWGIPYVKLMRRSPLAEKIMYPIALARAEEIGYHMGLRDKRSWRGFAIRVIMEPICFAIGMFVGEQDWRSVWRDEVVKA